MPNETRCGETPAGSVVIAPRGAEPWSRRATEAVLAGHAREMAKWSRNAVVVASDITVRLPRRDRLVRDKASGEQALMACGRERLLLVVSHLEVRRATDGSVSADIQVDFFGATCDRSERTIFEHGIDWYRVIFAKGRVEVLQTSSLAI